MIIGSHNRIVGAFSVIVQLFNMDLLTMLGQ